MSNFYKWDPTWVAAAQRALDPALEEAKIVYEKRTREEDDALLQEIMDEPLDADVELMHHYLGTNMTPEQLAAVEDRLANDEAFRHKVAPLIWLWECPLNLTPPSERPAPEPPEPHEPPRGTGEEVEYGPVAEHKAEIKATTLGMLKIVGIAFVAMVGLGGVGVHLLSVSAARAAQAVVETGEGRASTSAIFSPDVHSTNLAGNETFKVWDGIRAHIGPMTRLTRDAAPSGARNPRVSLDGDATIEITAPATGVRLETFAAFLQLTPGRYVIHCPPAAIEALVTIDSGTVLVGAGTPSSDHYIAVRRSGTIRVVPDGAGFLPYHPIGR